MSTVQHLIAYAAAACFIGSAVTALAGVPPESALRLVLLLSGGVLLAVYAYVRRRI